MNVLPSSSALYRGLCTLLGLLKSRIKRRGARNLGTCQRRCILGFFVSLNLRTQRKNKEAEVTFSVHGNDGAFAGLCTLLGLLKSRIKRVGRSQPRYMSSTVYSPLLCFFESSDSKKKIKRRKSPSRYMATMVRSPVFAHCSDF
jgi:hypothetical protein